MEGQRVCAMKLRLILLLVFCVCICGPAWGLSESAGPVAQQTAVGGLDRHQPAAVAPAAAYNLPPDKLHNAIVLGRIRTVLGIADSVWGIVFVWLLLATRWAARIDGWLNGKISRRWLQGACFFALFLVLSSIASLPLEAFGHWVSLHYGISVQGWLSWTGDQAKGFGLSVLFAPWLLLLFSWLVKKSPRWWSLCVWLVAMPLILLGIFATPLVIDPLFNKFEPLKNHHAALVDKLEQVVVRTGNSIAPERMFLMKASAKSNGLNAYVTGIGASKRYVMWDTATDRLPDDEILYIFGHESGHYMLNHIPQMIAFSALQLAVLLGGCGWLATVLARRKQQAWGLHSEGLDLAPLATRQGFLVALLLLSVAGFVLTPLSNAISRHYEHEADVYGQEAIHGLVADPQKTAVSAFNHLGEAWLEDPDPSPLVEIWEYNHPSVQRRANFAAGYNPWANGGRGRFFAK